MLPVKFGDQIYNLIFLCFNRYIKSGTGKITCHLQCLKTHIIQKQLILSKSSKGYLFTFSACTSIRSMQCCHPVTTWWTNLTLCTECFSDESKDDCKENYVTNAKVYGIKLLSFRQSVCICDIYIAPSPHTHNFLKRNIAYVIWFKFIEIML